VCPGIHGEHSSEAETEELDKENYPFQKNWINEISMY
jgi:hypothetical protein